MVFALTRRKMNLPQVILTEEPSQLSLFGKKGLPLLLKLNWLLFPFVKQMLSQRRLAAKVYEIS